MSWKFGAVCWKVATSDIFPVTPLIMKNSKKCPHVRDMVGCPQLDTEKMFAEKYKSTIFTVQNNFLNYRNGLQMLSDKC